MMREDWSDCANNDNSMRELTSKAKTSERITNMLLFLHAFVIFAFGIGVVVADVDVTSNTTELSFICKMEVPFEINTQRTFRCIVVTEFFCMFMWSFSGGTLNALLIILVSREFKITFHTAAQINIVCHWLTQLTSSEDESKDESLAIVTTKIIQKHKKIIRLSENIENLYTSIALMQFVSNSLMICVIAFLVVTSNIGSPNTTVRLVRTFLFCVQTNLEAYIFCYVGEYLKNKSNEIGLAAYNCPWYNMKSKDSHVLLFVILRSQKHLTLTAGKMMELSLKSFTSIMNASGSYLSILLAMQ
ncbi:PREDICTED: odorant receptor 4-like [Wasmannia auropunctata]|uniref:odorant receptor 4-like n=1 Tax=Wasmannia auropunctata TaxID=64793 RepID=UPI0005EECAAA|nr:PREDICTED: odorant receptor 4-like [Wasmannia auropunctata]